MGDFSRKWNIPRNAAPTSEVVIAMPKLELLGGALSARPKYRATPNADVRVKNKSNLINSIPLE